MKARFVGERSHPMPRVKVERLIAGTRRHVKLGGGWNGAIDKEAKRHISGQEMGRVQDDPLSVRRGILWKQAKIIRRGIDVSASASRRTHLD